MRVDKPIRPLMTVLVACSFAQAVPADVTGNVKFEGKPPEMAEIKAIKNDPICSKMHKDPVYQQTLVVGDNGAFMNVVVSIKTPDGKPFHASIPSKAVVLDQEGCMYTPHVVACMVGQAVEARSGDKCLHNVHTVSLINPGVNFAQPAPGVKKMDPFIAPENFKVTCNVHAWMFAWIRVLDNPYFAVTDEAGSYTIQTQGIPDGDYTLVAWQEQFQDKTLEQKITIKSGKTDKPVDFTFKPDLK